MTQTNIKIWIAVTFLIILFFFTQKDKPLGATILQDENEIALAEEQYFSQHGEYKQIKKGEKKGLSKDVSPEFRIDTYKTPEGEKGYVIRWEDKEFAYSKDSNGKLEKSLLNTR